MTTDVLTLEKVSPRSRSAAPVRKVRAAGLAGAGVVVAIWLLRESLKINVPPEVVSALTTIVTFATAYVVPPGRGEVVE